MNPNEMYEYLERITNLIRTNVRKSGLACGLLPVQLEALHYLARCNRYSDTPVAVAEFLGLTKGTVSQTLRLLENHGLLEKVTDSRDRRIVHLHLTLKGRQILDLAIPPTILNSALTLMSESEQKETRQTFERLLLSLQRANGLQTFGACKSCLHHQLADTGQRHCGLTRESLTDSDADKICREHRSAA